MIARPKTFMFIPNELAARTGKEISGKYLNSRLLLLEITTTISFHGNERSRRGVGKLGGKISIPVKKEEKKGVLFWRASAIRKRSLRQIVVCF